MIAAVRRVMEPGCKCDHVLVLEGAQGIGKSTALATLAGSWFSDEMPDMGSKDSAIQTSVAWIHEFAELAALARSQVEAIKAFVTRTVDIYRPPYGRATVEVQRQCVFAASTNTQQYLADETGNRRWWPVRCGERLDLDALRRDRDQLWAEAVVRCDAGVPHWLDEQAVEQEARAEQDARRTEDPWLEPIRAFLVGSTDTTMTDVLLRGLELDARHCDTSAGHRASRCLRALGWEAHRPRRADGSRITVWRKR
jgi:predicted P-loop ATPase